MSALSAIIAEEIAAHGPVTVARFMELALSHPEHGYYRTRDPLGAAGDFVTAPEVSQMFGELIGLWAAVVWESIGAPDPVIVAELGPGRGTLMADLARAARMRPAFTEAAEVHLVETSPALRRAQAAALAGLAPAWHEDLAEVPGGPIILIANEFFDALPIRQYVRLGDAWAERLVAGGADGAPFRFETGPAIAADAVPSGLPADAPDGAVKELCPAAAALAFDIGQRLAADSGAALIIDYGYAGPALADTLQAVRGHAYADPLADPGEADLTAHVDFSALSEAARAGGAQCFGPVSQGPFLMGLGIGQRAQRLAHRAGPARAKDIESALHRLIAPSEMGNLFKVLGLASPGCPELPGFGH